MSLRLILGIFILFLAVGIAFFLPGYNTNLALISIFIASFFTIFQLLNSSIMALMQAYMKVEFGAISAILAKFINLSLICLVAFWLFPKENIANNDYFVPFIFIMLI